jgi:IS5 family transposase
MKRQTFATEEGFGKRRRKTRKGEFPARMESLAPWAEFCDLIEPYYPKAGNGRPPAGVERMPRMYFLANGFNLADEACEEALYGIALLRAFCRIGLGRERAPEPRRCFNFVTCLKRMIRARGCLPGQESCCGPKG